ALGCERGTNEPARTDDPGEVHAEGRPSPKRHIVPVVSESISRRGPPIIQLQYSIGDESAIESGTEHIETQRGNKQRHGIESLVRKLTRRPCDQHARDY